MTVAEKPPLDDALLAHFGVKGMHWGVRRDRESGGSSRPTKPPKPKMATAKKVGIGIAIVGGAAAAAYILKRRGGLKISKVAKVTESAVPHHTPSPFELRLQAGMAAHRVQMQKIGAQKLTDQAWRDQARINLLRKQMDSTTSNLMSGNMDAIRRAMQRTS